MTVLASGAEWWIRQHRSIHARIDNMPAGTQPLHVSLVALPECAISTLTGIYDVLGSFRMLADTDSTVPDEPPFEIDIVAAERGRVDLASGLPVIAGKALADVGATDIVIVPSIFLPDGIWCPGRYGEHVAWAQQMHVQGAQLCSACSGVLMLAETGLFDGQDATVHWAYADGFASVFPRVRLHPDRALVASGEREELVTSGASTSWHDLVLYLIARHVGATAAQSIAKYFALQWHHDGLGPYIVFQGRFDHGDGLIAETQSWLSTHFSVGRPVEESVKRSGLPERTFKRRFRDATGFAPIDYVQRLRIEDAKRRLERTDTPIDEISWQVGYEDAAFFRRVFKRITGVTPGAYRKRFRMPDFAGPKHRATQS